MNIFNRIANLITGFFNVLIGGVERSNPALVYEQAIDNKIKKHNKLRKAVANLTMMRNTTQASLQEEKDRLNEVESYLEAAMDDGDDDSALMLLEQKNECEDRLQQLENEYETISSQTDEAMESLQNHRNEIDKLKRERNFKLAQHRAAELKNQAYEEINGISEDADSKAIDNIRKQIDSEIAQADMNSEINNGSHATKMRKLKVRSSKLKALKQLEEMKAKKQQVKAQKSI